MSTTSESRLPVSIPDGVVELAERHRIMAVGIVVTIGMYVLAAILDVLGGPARPPSEVAHPFNVTAGLMGAFATMIAFTIVVAIVVQVVMAVTGYSVVDEVEE